MSVYTLISNMGTIQDAPTRLVKPNNVYGLPSQSAALQVILNGTGSCTATVELLGSNDGMNVVNLGTVVVDAADASTASGVGSLVTTGPWDRYGAIVTDISGTDAAATALMST